MQEENFLKDLERIRFEYHIHSRDSMAEQIDWIIHNIKEITQEYKEYERDLSDERNDYMWMLEEAEQRIESLEDQIEWIKTLTAYGFNDFRSGKLSYD